MKHEFISKNVNETIAFAKVVAEHVFKKSVIALSGDLGAGKTTFTQGLASALNIDERVISPTFNILKCYLSGDIPLYHIDAYRLEGETADIGLLEFIDGDGVAVIEWPKFISDLLPENYLEIKFEHLSLNERKITIMGKGDYEAIVKSVKELF